MPQVNPPAHISHNDWWIVLESDQQSLLTDCETL